MMCAMHIHIKPDALAWIFCSFLTSFFMTSICGVYPLREQKQQQQQQNEWMNWSTKRKTRKVQELFYWKILRWKTICILYDDDNNNNNNTLHVCVFCTCRQPASGGAKIEHTIYVEYSFTAAASVAVASGVDCIFMHAASECRSVGLARRLGSCAADRHAWSEWKSKIKRVHPHSTQSRIHAYSATQMGLAMGSSSISQEIAFGHFISCNIVQNGLSGQRK